MTLAIMQPYIFPYIGYWQLINAADTFVVYDNIQFSKSGWFHRNNILLNGQKTLFSIPLKKDSDSLDVVDRFISDEAQKQINKILAQIENSYKKSPYFKNVFPLIEGIFKYDEKNLFKYIYNSIIQVCQYLDIKTQIVISSRIDVDHSLIAQEKVIAINKALNSTQYINPIGGTELYDTDAFERENIQLNFLESEIPEYKQLKGDFIPYLSIIDVLMFNSKEDIKNMLEKYKKSNKGGVSERH
jgi:hypothetical protein